MMQLVAHRRGAEEAEARLAELVEVATELHVAAEARSADVAALRDVVSAGGNDRVVVDQSVDLLRNLRGMRRRAVWLLDALHGLRHDDIPVGRADLTGPAAALALALSAAEHAVAPLAAAHEQSNVPLIGGVSVAMTGRFVPIMTGSSREARELLSLALGAVTAQPGVRRRPRILRAVTSTSGDEE